MPRILRVKSALPAVIESGMSRSICGQPGGEHPCQLPTKFGTGLVIFADVITADMKKTTDMIARKMESRFPLAEILCGVEASRAVVLFTSYLQDVSSSKIGRCSLPQFR